MSSSWIFSYPPPFFFTPNAFHKSSKVTCTPTDWIIFYVVHAGCWNIKHAAQPRPLANIPTRDGPRKTSLDRAAGSSSCLKNAFKGILLVIVYNYPHFDSVPLLTSLYKPAFPHLLFCGPPSNSSYQVMEVDIRRGILGYECLGRAIRKHPGYQGYFYINDDVILNFWNFYYFNRNIIWESPFSFGSTGVYEPTSATGWYWWVSPYGLLNCRRAYEEVANLSHQWHTKGFNINNAITTLYRNGNGSLRCYSGRSDVLYIPGKHATGFSVLSGEFYKHKVFLEIAIPTMLRLLDRKENIRQMDGYYIPGDVRKGDPRVTDSRHFWSFYFLKNKLWFIHPFKLHHADLDNKFNKVMLRYVLLEKSKAVALCHKNWRENQTKSDSLVFTRKTNNLKTKHGTIVEVSLRAD